jgi:hypothetical protein
MGHDNPAHRQPVSWFADRATDVGVDVQRMSSTREEEVEAPVSIPAIHIDGPASGGVPDPMADIEEKNSQ